MFGFCSARKLVFCLLPSFYMIAHLAPRRTLLRISIAILFALSGASQLLQLAVQLLAAEPHWARAGFHLLCGSAGVATAYAAWVAARWGWLTVLAWGVSTVTLLLSLPAMNLVSTEEAAGLPAGAITVAVIAALTAWYLCRITAGERS